jgi:hypothetical protein
MKSLGRKALVEGLVSVSYRKSVKGRRETLAIFSMAAAAGAFMLGGAGPVPAKPARQYAAPSSTFLAAQRVLDARIDSLGQNFVGDVGIADRLYQPL